MPIYRIADLNIKINHKYKYTYILCHDYLADNQDIEPDFEISACQQEIEKDKAILPDMHESYLESLSIYRQIAKKMLDYNGIVLHAAVIEMDGKAYAFTAPSGTGKSTHTALWLKAFEGKARIINGDKPLLRLIDDVLYIYGTPWCGKEGININTKVPLSSICFISQAKENEISPLDKNLAVTKIFTQLLMPENENQTNRFFDMVEEIFNRVDFYSLKCNMDIEAAFVAYEGMNK